MFFDIFHFYCNVTGAILGIRRAQRIQLLQSQMSCGTLETLLSRLRDP